MEIIMKKKVLILWISGMLWNVLYKYLYNTNFYELSWTISWNNKNYISFYIDNNYITKIEQILEKWKYDYVLNCIWYIRPDFKKIEDYNKSFLINSHFPKTLQSLSQKYNYKLIHFSTDCVFDWLKWNYSINDIPNELNTYWMSKYLWEIYDNKNITIRTSIIWIEENDNSKNLLNWFLSNKDWDIVKWYSNVYWNWLTTLTIAKIVHHIISDDIILTWLIQLWWEKISKYNLLKLFNEVFSKNIIIKDENNIFSDKTIITSINNKNIINLIIPLREQLLELKEFYNI